VHPSPSLTLVYHRVLKQTASIGAGRRFTLSTAVFAKHLDWIQEIEASSGCSIRITFDDGCAAFVDSAWPMLIARGRDVTQFVVPGFAGCTALWNESDVFDLMDWPTLECLTRHGLKLGSHLMSHTHLSQLTPIDLRREAELSRSLILDRLKLDVSEVAVPYGFCTADQARALLDAGYDHVHLVDGPWFASSEYPSHVTARIEMRGDKSFSDCLPSQWLTELDIVI